MASESVWDRKGSGNISRNQFNLLMGVVLVGGLIATAITANMSVGWMEFVPAAAGKKATFNWVGPVNMWVMVIGVLVSGFTGIGMAMGSDKPLVSLTGFALLAVPFGFLVGPTVGMYTPDSVLKVFVITTGVVGILMIVGTVIPESLDGWQGYLFGGLTILIVGQFGLMFVRRFFPGLPVKGVMTALDWFGVIVFSGYVIYDINRAQRVPATADNAIDSALALYLDIVNLFLKFLRIFGTRKDESGSSN